MMIRVLRRAQRLGGSRAALYASSRGLSMAPLSTQRVDQQQRQGRPNGAEAWGLGALLIGACAATAVDRRRETECAGIVGVVGVDDARAFLLEGLEVLRNRGYDSAGMATVGPENTIVVTKFADEGSTHDSIDLVRDNTAGKHHGHHIGVAHTRWATQGGTTDQNAHPHMDVKKRVAVVHNGTILNAHDLRSELQSKGIKFRSETDTEVIAQLIGLGLHKNLSLKEATEEALQRCEGTWGLAVLSREGEDEIVVACNGSPMVVGESGHSIWVVLADSSGASYAAGCWGNRSDHALTKYFGSCAGIGEGKIFIASETSAFNRSTKNFIAMKDGEIGVVRADGSDFDLTRVQKATESHAPTSPAPYAHWAIRECMEQPEAIARALGFGGRLSDTRVFLGGPDRAKETLRHVQNMVLTGCGTSLHAALYGAKLMRDYESFLTCSAIDATELRPSDLPRGQGGLIAITQSGETKDVYRAVLMSSAQGIPALSVVNTVGSLVARTTKLGVYLNAGRENSVASTKSFTNEVTTLALLTAWFRQLREEEGEEGLPAIKDLLDALQRLPISFGQAQRTREHCKKIAERLKEKEHLFLLGKGYGEPIAFEGARKLMEMANLHAEGYSGGALKHGPFALIEGPEGKFGSTPIILLILDDEHAQHMRTAAEEVKSRGADVIIITDNAKLARGIVNDPVVIPSNGPLTALIAILPLQLIAYELALLRGVNPDRPRNLAKHIIAD